jgi:hypothetical protein
MRLVVCPALALAACKTLGMSKLRQACTQALSCC